MMDLITEGAEQKAKQLEQANSESPYGDINTKPSKKTAKMLASVIPGVGSADDYIEDEQDEAGEEEGDETLEGEKGNEVDEASGEQGQEGNDSGEANEESEDGKGEEAAPSQNYDAIKADLVNVYGEEELSTPEGVEEAVRKVIEERNSLDQDRETFEAVTNLFEESDEIVQVAKHLKDGYTFNEALASVIDFDSWQEELKENDPDEYKKVLKRQMEREHKLKEAKKADEKRREAFQENQKKSTKEWESFKKEHFSNKDGKVNEKEAEEFAQAINNQIQHLADGYTPEEFFKVMYRGLRYGDAVKEAKEKGKVEGANKAIKDKTAKTRGDGTPDLKRGQPRKSRSAASLGKKAVAGAVGRKAGSSDWR